MKEQHGVYMAKDEWLACMAAIARGMRGFVDDLNKGEGDMTPPHVMYVDHCATVLTERVFDELGLTEDLAKFRREQQEKNSDAKKG